MKILFLSHQADFLYGGEICTLELMRELSEQDTVYFASPEGPYLARVRSEVPKARILCIPSRQFSRDIDSLFLLPGALSETHRQLKALISSERIDSLHATSLKAMVYAWRLGLSGVPVVWHHHDILPDTFSNRTWLKVIARAAKKIAVPSNAAARALGVAGVPITKVHVVYNGFAPAKWKRRVATDLPFTFGYVGELSSRKGVEVLPSLCELLESQGEAWRLHVIGEALSEPVFGKEVIERLRLFGSRVQILGRREDIPSQLRLIDILLVPSRQDPLPTVIIEALFSGVPVLARAIGGIPEMITNGVEGFLFERDEDLLPIASKLLSDRVLLGKMGEAARLRAEAQFSAAAMSKGVRKLHE